MAAVFLIPALLSIILFVLGLLRFPQTSFQFIILMFVAALLMFLAMSLSIIPVQSSATTYSGYTENVVIGASTESISISSSNSITTSNPSPGASQIGLTYDVSYIYIVVCMVFALMGVILKLSGRE
jgi:NADH:ubiquinone oxidoreductase subunit K